MVSNLLNNAAKYTEPHGEIAVSAARQGGEVVLARARQRDRPRPEILPRIFDLFVQERQALDRAQGGLGLGLAIARILVELHGGTVGARSEGPGRGSEFVVRLPARAAASAGRRPERGIAPRPDALRVLVVDDNADAAELLAESVRLLGHVAQAAHDGPAGLRIAARFRPDLALLDIGLPVMDGYELARHLRAMPGLGALRLVAVTGYSQDEDERQSAAAGFERHLVKPIRLEQLEALLARRPPAGR